MDCFKYINGFTFAIVTQIFFFIFLLSASKPVEADDDTLVKTLCDQSLEPDICVNCILSDTGRESSNVSDVTHSVLYCMYTQTTNAQQSAEILFRDTQEVELKKTFGVCKNVMFSASNMVWDGLIKMEASDYKNAHKSARNANLDMLQCVFAFRKYTNIPIPPGLLEYMVQAKRLFDVAEFMFLLIDHQ